MFRLLLTFWLISSAAFAEPAPNTKAGGIEVPTDVLKEFQVIEQLSAQGKYPEASRKAEAVLPRLSDRPDARALLLHNLATLYGLQKHHAHAAGILEECLSLHALPAEEASKAQFELGQYLAIAENYPRAASALENWLNNAESPKPEQLLILADVYLRLHRNQEAIPLVERVIASSAQPKPEWHQLLLGLHHEAHDHKNCIRVLMTLIERSPGNAQYWSQLTGIYQEAGDDQRALAVQQLMYKRGLLKSSQQILQLAQVMRFRGLSARAAEMLQTEMEKGVVEKSAKNLDLLASTWMEAKELQRAANTLEQSLALSYAPDSQHRLGQIYSELHDWPKAQRSLAQAVSKGGLKNPGGAYLLLGLANYRMNAKDRARDAFTKAQEMESVRKTAQQWLEHINKEKPARRS
jgi:tetratricopeptide (TPR) repeat protein